MKLSLIDLFDCTLSQLHIHFDIQPQLEWAIANLQSQISHSLSLPNWTALEESAKRSYLEKALAHYQGNLDELSSGTNTSIRILKDESHYDPTHIKELT